MEAMYAPQNNGPHTMLVKTINSTGTSITVEDASVLPAAPNVLTIGTDEDAELVLLESVTGNLLTVRRGFNGTIAKEWPEETWVYRAITAQDVAALQERAARAEVFQIDLTADELSAMTMEQRAQMYADGTRLIYVKGGSADVLLMLDNNGNLHWAGGDTSNDLGGIITTVARQIIDRVYPVSIILDFAAETDPNTAIGCGTKWARMADGRVLIASDAAHPVGWVGGEATHVLTEAEMPAHSHSMIQVGTDGERIMSLGKDGSYGSDSFLSFGTTVKAFVESTIMINGTGGNQPHNNMQPSLSVCRWQRTA